jgi:hypothetical protein
MLATVIINNFRVEQKIGALCLFTPHPLFNDSFICSIDSVEVSQIRSCTYILNQTKAEWNNQAATTKQSANNLHPVFSRS